MTITKEQLDELEIYAVKCAKFTPPRDAALSSVALLQLVAVARAALALDASLEAMWSGENNMGSYGAFDTACHALHAALRGAP